MPTLSSVWDAVRLDAMGTVDVDIKADVTKVEIKAKGKGGVVMLHYGSEGELDRLFEAMKQGPKRK